MIYILLFLGVLHTTHTTDHIIKCCENGDSATVRTAIQSAPESDFYNLKTTCKALKKVASSHPECLIDLLEKIDQYEQELHFNYFYSNHKKWYTFLDWCINNKYLTAASYTIDWCSVDKLLKVDADHQTYVIKIANQDYTNSEKKKSAHLVQKIMRRINRATSERLQNFINIENNYHHTAFDCALNKSNVHIAQKLLIHVMPEKLLKTSYGVKPLFIALQEDWKYFFMRLLQRAYQIHVIDTLLKIATYNKQTAFHIALYNSDREYADILYKYCSWYHLVQEDRWGQTPFHLAHALPDKTLSNVMLTKIPSYLHTELLLFNLQDF